MSTANPYTELTQQTREDLVLEHAPQIKRIVTRMAARFPPGVDQEELYQAVSYTHLTLPTKVYV